MTRLTKIPMIAAFSAVIAAFTITAEASADPGDGRHYQAHRGDGGRGGDYRGRSYNDSHRQYRGQYRGEIHRGESYRGDRYRGNRDNHVDNRNWHRDQWRGERRWSDNRYHDHRHDDRRWHGDRRYYSGYHGRPYYRDHRYDYRRPWYDRDYYWQHRQHYSSWRPYYGPVWGGYRHAYWRDRGCVPVTRYWTWDGRPALVGGVQCYDPRGVAFVVSNDYYLLGYY